MGVADGVYMWKELGIDSGTMSRTLMETSMHMVQAGHADVFKGGYLARTMVRLPAALPHAASGGGPAVWITA